jgi:hypothetical protein
LGLIRLEIACNETRQRACATLEPRGFKASIDRRRPRCGLDASVVAPR